MRMFDHEHHPIGETIPEKERAFRFDHEVIETFLKGGVALSKFRHFRPLLERLGTRLADRSTLARMVPLVLSRENGFIKEWIKDKHVSVVFDGSSRLGEALAVMLRFLDDGGSVKQLLVRLKVLSKSLTGEELAGEVIDILSNSMQIQRQHVVAVVRDGASVNGAAMRIVKAVFPKLLDITCFSHAIDLVGSYFELPVLDQFMQWWVNLFARSAAAKLCWKERTGIAMKTYSPTRWWSKRECMMQVLQFFGDVIPFLEENIHIGPRLSNHLLNLLQDEDQKKK